MHFHGFFTEKIPFVSHEKSMKIPLIFNASGPMKKNSDKQKTHENAVK